MNRIDKNIVSQHLNRLADMLEVAYPNLIDIKLYPVENKDSEFTCDVCHKISSRNPAEIFVNTIQLVETMENDTVDFDMFVWTVKDFYHEYRHFQQAYYFYQDENSTDDILFMAQLRYVSLALPATKQDKASMRHFPFLKDSIQEGKCDYRCKRADRLDGLKNHNIFKYIEQEEGHEQMSSEQQSDDFSF